MKFNFKAFILALIFCAIIISTKNLYSCELSAQSDRGIYRAISLGEIDRLYSGSSMFRQGINIPEAEKKLQSGFLIWYGGLDPASEALILEYMVDHGLIIKNLYVDMYAYSACRASWPSDVRMFFESPIDLKIKIWKLIMQNKNANIFSTVWEMFIHSGNDMFIMWPIYRELVKSRYYRGGYPASANDNIGLTPEEIRAKPLVENGGNGTEKINPDQKNAVIKIINMCRENNIKLFFVETPKYTATNKSKGYKSIMTEYLEIMNEHNTNCIMSSETLREINAQPRGNITRYDFNHDEASFFTDVIHLSTKGSIAFTDILTEIN